ncbi:MAG TPA: hypothetical protein VMS45_09090, partial [Gemmatimonadaceae bacterium]|nr:hypothetical protein [Gemmatimonadaceae bacterium]
MREDGLPVRAPRDDAPRDAYRVSLGAGAEAAARALREGLVETVRTETKGKTAIDWVRVTPKAVDFLHEHESPLRALEELREELRATRERVPAWSEEARRTLAALGDRLA